jgi:hypothetical protein
MAVLICTSSLVAITSSAAAEFSVTSTADGGPGSLRDAFASASASLEAAEIVLQSDATYVLDDCGQGDLDYTGPGPLTILGNGSAIQQTCAGERVIESDADVVVQDVTITGGDSPGLGGGIEADTSDVTVVRSSVVGNRASIGGGVGAIRVTLAESTVSGNEASTAGGIWADQTLHATNSTISGNEATTAGGGLAIVNTSATLLYSTVVANTAPTGANVQLQDGSDELVSFATVIAGAAGGGADCDIDEGAIVMSQGYNLSSDGSCGFGSGTGDLAAAGDPGLGVLAVNGGPTETHLPDAASPLLDVVDCAAAPQTVSTDQRGVARPQGGLCDIGAVEVESDATPATPAPTPPSTATSPRFTG